MKKVPAQEGGSVKPTRFVVRSRKKGPLDELGRPTEICHDYHIIWTAGLGDEGFRPYFSYNGEVAILATEVASMFGTGDVCEQ